MGAKITIIGAGNVGATAAEKLVRESVAGMLSEVVLLDIKEPVAVGKAIDLIQANPESSVRVTGTSRYIDTKGSDIIVITSGVPRKPGMTREELVGVNSKVMKSVLDQAAPLSPKAIYVIVSNPMDTMTYFTVKYLGIDPARVVGMGGDLDTRRFKYYISQKLGCSMKEIKCSVIGGHGDTTMIPLTSSATVSGKPLKELLSKEDITDIVENTMKGGATLTSLIGTSAWYAPGECTAELVLDILGNTGKMHNCSVYLKDMDICIGQPVFISRAGFSFPYAVKYSKVEKHLLIQSIEAVKKVNTNLEP